MFRELFRNRLIITAYVLGIITVIIAVYVVLMPYKVDYYYNGTAVNRTFSINPSDVVFIILRTDGGSLSVNLTVVRWIPETNITITLYYTEYLNPNQTKILNFTTLTSLSIVSMGQGDVEVLGVHRPEFINILTIILTILFILVIALLVIGFVESIINIHGKA